MKEILIVVLLSLVAFEFAMLWSMTSEMPMNETDIMQEFGEQKQYTESYNASSPLSEMREEEACAEACSL